MKRKISLILIILLALSSCTNKQEQSLGKEDGIRIVDILEREIILDEPLDRVLIQGSGSGGPLMTMVYLDNDNFYKKIAGMDDGLRAHRNDLYKRMVKEIPALDDIKRISDFSKNDFSLEEILSLDADGIIVPISYKAQLDSIEDKLDIPIIYINYHNQDFDDHLRSTEIIAKATGLDKNLDLLSSFYKEKTSYILDKVKDLDSKPSVYLEQGYDGEILYGNSYGDQKMWGKMINDSGGYNISGEVLGDEGANPIAEEFLLSKDPDMIILTGSSWLDKKDSLHMGFETSKDEVRAKLDKYRQRTGWDKLSAIKNNKIYAIGHNLSRDMSDFSAYQYLAKTFHPQVFEDLDPEKDMKEFYDKFMPIAYEGTWFVSYE